MKVACEDGFELITKKEHELVKMVQMHVKEIPWERLEPRRRHENGQAPVGRSGARRERSNRFLLPFRERPGTRLFGGFRPTRSGARWVRYRRARLPPNGTCRRRAAIVRWRVFLWRFLPAADGRLWGVRTMSDLLRGIDGPPRWAS